MGLAQVQHSPDKVLSVHSEYPRGTDNKMLFYIIGNCQFPFQLCLPIDIQRIVILAVRLPWTAPLSVKHIVRRQVKHLTAYLLTCKRNIFGSCRIDHTDPFNLVLLLCHIHRRPCRTVNHRIRLLPGDNLIHRNFIRNVHSYIWHRCHSSAVCGPAVGWRKA